MITAKCCICGTVKNCGPFLEKVFKNIETIGKIFDDYKIIMSYDYSTDNSLNILKQYQLEHPDNFILHIETQPFLPYRTHNISRARNKCLDIIRNNFIDYEYFIMIDCDNVCAEPVKLEYLLYYLKINIEWDALSFNKEPYYDTWALSKYPLVFSNMHFKNPDRYGVFIKNIIKNTSKGTLIHCLSAFNGFAIYRTNKFINCYYDPKPRLDLIPKHIIEKNIQLCGTMYLKGKGAIVDCEHRSFHLMAVNNGARIRIAPEVIFY